MAELLRKALSQWYLMAALVLLAGILSADQSVQEAEVTDFSGNVQVLRKFAKTPVAAGQKLQASDYLVTGEGAAVQLRFGAGNDVRLGEKSRLKISKLFGGTEAPKLGSLELLKGVVRCKLAKLNGNEFEVRTPVAVAGVRGTDFVVGYAPQARGPAAFSMTVITGSVGVKSTPDRQQQPAFAPVVAGPEQRVEVTQGEEAKVTQVPPGEVQRLVQENAIVPVAAKADKKEGQGDGGDKAPEGKAAQRQEDKKEGEGKEKKADGQKDEKKEDKDAGQDKKDEGKDAPDGGKEDAGKDGKKKEKEAKGGKGGEKKDKDAGKEPEDGEKDEAGKDQKDGGAQKADKDNGKKAALDKPAGQGAAQASAPTPALPGAGFGGMPGGFSSMDAIREATQEKIREAQQAVLERSRETIQENLREEIQTRSRNIDPLPMPLPDNRN